MIKPVTIREALVLLWGVSAGFLVVGCSTTVPEGTVKKPSEASARTDSTSPDALASFSMGLLDELEAHSESATTNFLEAIEHDPDNEELYWLAAERLTVQSRKVEAMAVFDKLIAHKPKSHSGYLWKGWLLQTMQEPDLAELQYRKAISVSPRHLGAYMRLAHSQISRKDFAEAAKVLEKAIAKVDETLRPYELLGEVYQQMSKAAEEEKEKQNYLNQAIKTYTRALKKHEDHRKFLYQLGLLYSYRGETTKALKLLTQFEALKDNNLQIKYELVSSIIHAMGGTNEATARLEAYMVEFPNDGRVAYYVGNMHERAGRADKALHYYTLSAGLPPLESAPIWKQSILLVQQTNLTEAVAVLEIGIERIPDDARLLEMLAVVELQRTNFSAAKQAFAKVEKILLKKRHAQKHAGPVDELRPRRPTGRRPETRY